MNLGITQIVFGIGWVMLFFADGRRKLFYRDDASGVWEARAAS